MNKKEKNNVSSLDDELLKIINTSYLSNEDVKWLKSKRWFKRFIKIYAKELKERYKDSKPIKKEIKTTKEDIEVLDFTQSINIPPKEVIEVLDFTKTIDVTNVKDISESAIKAKKRVKIEKTLWSILIVVSTLIAIVLIVILVNWNLENKKTNNIVESIYKVANVKEITTKSNAKTKKNKVLSYYEKYGNMNMLEVNFNNLKNINPDTVGWIKVDGTKINYPFVKTDNNEYYLKHSFDKSSNKKGWVFLDFRNNIDNLSRNTILYAHGLVNNQMFGSMRKVIKPNWYNNKKNHILKVSTPNSNQLWQVFSVYTIEPESYYITTNFSDNDFSDFIDKIKKRSINDFNVEVKNSDKILTLSSCYDNKKRMVLHAKLINYENK
ncbi:MAG: class B sortase [Bacilli bacterium]|nr:class B sortase [Bacilli bacterium]